MDSLPDQVWLKILGYLTSDQLLIWTNLNEDQRRQFPLAWRLFHLCGDKSLWQNIHWQGGNVKPIVLRKIVRFLGCQTKEIILQGEPTKQRHKQLSIPESLLHSIQNRCHNLKSIKLINCTLDFHCSPLKKLPQRRLETIVLSGVEWINLPNIKTLHNSPYFRLKKRLPNLLSVQVLNCHLDKYDQKCLENGGFA